MANIREIRDRIKSIKDIMKITNAMYLISSSKMKRAKKALDDTAPYFHTLQSTIDHILKHTPHTSNLFFHRREEIPEEKRKKGYLVITADKGLCGAYNHNVLKILDEELKKKGEHKLFIIGQSGRMYCARNGIEYEEYFRYTAQNPRHHRAREIADILIDKFLNEEIDDLYVIYTEMVTAMSEEAKIKMILPFKREKFHSRIGTVDYEVREIHHMATFDPSPEVVMDNLVPNFLRGLIYGAMVESFGSEQHARMTAMDSATNSARDIVRELELVYNRARQAAITQEITEIVGGANSLKNK